jgi:hypothetical protein
MQTKESGISPTVTLHKAFNAKHNVSEADDDEGRIDNIPYLNENVSLEYESIVGWSTFAM